MDLMSDGERIVAALEPVRRQFRLVTAARILEIEALRGSIMARDKVDISVARVARLAHMMSGTAATLGFARLGSLAARLELRLDPVTQPQSAIERWAAAQDDLDDLLDAMEAVLDS